MAYFVVTILGGDQWENYTWTELVKADTAAEAGKAALAIAKEESSDDNPLVFGIIGPFPVTDEVRVIDDLTELGDMGF